MSERISSPLSRLPRAALLYGLGDAVGRATNIIALPILTRAMTPGEFGIVVGVTAYAQVLSLVMQLNLSASLIRFHYETPDPDHRRSLFSTLIWFSIGWSLVLTLGLFLFGRSLLDNLFQHV